MGGILYIYGIWKGEEIDLGTIEGGDDSFLKEFEKLRTEYAKNESVIYNGDLILKANNEIDIVVAGGNGIRLFTDLGFYSASEYSQETIRRIWLEKRHYSPGLRLDDKTSPNK